MPFAASWLAEQSNPTFLNLYTITNHHPWIAPPNWTAPVEAGNHPYHSTFAYTDHALGLLIDELRSKKLLEKCVLFIFGDHGQKTDLENPYSAFNSKLYQENINVPLLVYAEGRISSPKKIDTLASHVDLLPTIMDLFQLRDPHHSLGKSLLRASTDPIFFIHPFDSVIQGIREGSWKLLIDEAGEELYNLEQDPEEKTNLFRINPEIVTKLKPQLLEFTSTLNALYESKSFAPAKKGDRSFRTGPNVYQIDFSRSLRLNDSLLEEILKECPNLVKLNLSGCKLITDQGIKAALTHCTLLEDLNVDELDDLTGLEWPVSIHLSEFRALACPRFEGWKWLQSLHSLRGLHLESDLMEDAHLMAMSEKLHALHTLSFKGLSFITDVGLSALLKANPFLKLISIFDSPLITDASILLLKGSVARLIQIGACPQVTQAVVDNLAPQPGLIIQRSPIS